MSLFKALRVGLLLMVLVIVAGSQWLGAARLAEWERTVWITIYPIPADGHPDTLDYVQGLAPEQFDEIGDFFTREARRYGLDLPRAAHFQLAPVPSHPPPAVPRTDSFVTIGLWSLKMRWYAWRRSHQDGLLDPDIQVFMLYRAPDGNPRLDRSVGVQKGRYTVVNAYASPGMASRNRVVIAHELLHVLGASDKYDLATGQPIAPDGLAHPVASPLYPQRQAEIMGGAIAESPNRSRMPAGLSQTLVGPATAREIGWSK